MIDNLSSFREMIRYISEKYAYRTAFSILGKGTRKCITYKQFYDDVIYTSGILKISGVPVAIFAENTYEWIVLYLSIGITGNIVVPMDTTASVDIITKQLEDSMCSIILCSDRYFKFLKDIQQKSGNRIKLIKISDIFNLQYLSIADIIKESNETQTTLLNAYNNASVVIYTSGTTAQQKGVLLTQKNILSDAISASKIFSFAPCVVLILPLYHAFGLTAGVVVPLIEGCEVVLCDYNYSIVKCIKESNAESTIVVPAMLKLFRDNIIANNNDIGVMGNIRQIVCGGAMVQEELLDFFEERNISIYVGYGLSECAPVVSTNGNRLKKKGSVGKILDCCSVVIQNPDQNGYGEIIVKGDNVTKGYLNLPHCNLSSFETDYFKTGDIGYMDDDGFLFVTGRLKDTIVLSNGKKIAPGELESRIGSIPFVKEVAVFLEETDDSREIVVAEIFADNQDTGEGYREKIQKKGDINETNYYKLLSLVHILKMKKPSDHFCGAGFLDLSIDFCGNIYPCFMFNDNPEFVMGNVYNENSKAFLYKREVYINNRISKNDDCANCWAHGICSSGHSGCIGAFYLENGTINTPVVHNCTITKSVFETVLCKIAEYAPN